MAPLSYLLDFFLPCFFAHLRLRLRRLKDLPGQPRRLRRGSTGALVVIAVAVLSMIGGLCKEPAFTTPVLLCILEVTESARAGIYCSVDGKAAPHHSGRRYRCSSSNIWLHTWLCNFGCTSLSLIILWFSCIAECYQ